MKIFTFLILAVEMGMSSTEVCGCKSLRPCYKQMLDSLQAGDEERCVENASIGACTILIFLKAIRQFCPATITYYEDYLTWEGRHLYEVILHIDKKKDDEHKPVILIDAGQTGSTEAVGLAVYFIEQLVACEENNDMLENVEWVILPSTNPDGMEFAKFNRKLWRKNMRKSEDGLSFGVDISRNFDHQWTSCDKVDSGFSPIYAGKKAASENETIFIKGVLSRHKNFLKAYLSIRRDGHGIFYPYSYSGKTPQKTQIIKVAADIAAKVNLRLGGIQNFVNDSIYNANGFAYCGHSVDFAFDDGVALAYEMRVFQESDNRIMSQFQRLPKGYENSLRAGYLTGLKELYRIVTDKKHAASFK